MPIQYGVLLGLWDSKPILFYFILFWFIYLFLSIYISIIYFTKKVAYGG
jgi:hypothetical protein